MKKIALGLLVLSACSTSEPSDETTRFEEWRAEMSAVQFIAYDPAQVRVGQRVVYKFSREGDPAPMYVKMQAVEAGPNDTIWIEKSIPVGTQTMIRKARIDRQGKLQEEWVRPPGGEAPVQVYPPRDGKLPEAPKPPSDVRVEQSVSDETVKAAGKSYLCKKVTTKLIHPDGRTTSMTNWCHPDVPFSLVLGGNSLGGVVKRVYGKWTLELVEAAQTGARSEVEIPRR